MSGVSAAGMVLALATLLVTAGLAMAVPVTPRAPAGKSVEALHVPIAASDNVPSAAGPDLPKSNSATETLTASSGSAAVPEATPPKHSPRATPGAAKVSATVAMAVVHRAPEHLKPPKSSPKPPRAARRKAARRHRTARRFTRAELQPLLNALERHGFKRETIRRVFYDSRLRKLDRVVAINAINPETPADYDQFTTPYAIHKARRFERRHRRELRAVERRYGVPKDVLVAILLVETQFGQARLPYRVLDVFTTLAVEGHPHAVQRAYARIRHHHPDVEKQWLAERLMEKAQFALRELVATLSMFRDNLKHLYQVRGSYAGAIGLPQFLPTSYQRWAVDGNGDGRIDLNDVHDALPSIANYLRGHGWSRNADFQDRWRAIWEYNHSPDYVQTIFEIVFRLDAPSHKRR